MTRLRMRSLLALILGLLPLAGCDTPARTASSPTASEGLVDTGQPPGTPPRPPKPDLARLDYDVASRRLVLYTLEDRGARWMLVTVTSPSGIPIDEDYEFPLSNDPDLDQVAIFYTLPNHRPSQAVSLREIVEAHAIRALR